MSSVKELYEYLWATDSIISGAGEVWKGFVNTRSSQLPPPEIRRALTIKNNDMEKICKKCGKTLPIESFAKNLRSKDGYMHICKECWAEVREAGKLAAKETTVKELVTVESAPVQLHTEVMETIEQSSESLGKTIAESKLQDEKIHELSLKALELFDDDSLIQALRDRGFEGEIYKKFRL